MSYSKRLRLDDSCNNLNDTLNSASKNNTKWSYSGDANLVEPEILEDMGVSMLEDEASSYESTKKTGSLEQTTSPIISDNSGQCDKINSFQSQENIYRGSNFDTVSMDRFVFQYNHAFFYFFIYLYFIYFHIFFYSFEATRRLDHDPYESDELTTYSTIGNESGYSSKMEIDNLIDTKETFSKNDLNDSSVKSSLEQFYLYRRKRKPSIVGEDKFNKLSDEMILMILKWLPKKCLVR